MQRGLENSEDTLFTASDGQVTCWKQHIEAKDQLVEIKQLNSVFTSPNTVF